MNFLQPRESDLRLIAHRAGTVDLHPPLDAALVEAVAAVQPCRALTGLDVLGGAAQRAATVGVAAVDEVDDAGTVSNNLCFPRVAPAALVSVATRTNASLFDGIARMGVSCSVRLAKIVRTPAVPEAQKPSQETNCTTYRRCPVGGHRVAGSFARSSCSRARAAVPLFLLWQQKQQSTIKARTTRKPKPPQMMPTMAPVLRGAVESRAGIVGWFPQLSGGVVAFRFIAAHSAQVLC